MGDTTATDDGLGLHEHAGSAMIEPDDLPEAEPDYSTRLSRWRHTTRSGTLAAATMLGLQSLQAALEGRDIQRPEIVLVMDAAGEGDDDDELELDLDPYDPRESRAIFKPRAPQT